MSKLDSRLKQRLQTAHSEGVEALQQRVSVFLEFSDDLETIKQHGFALQTLRKKLAVGTIALSDVEKVAALDNVVRIEMGRPLRPQLNDSVPEIEADEVHKLAPTPYKGRGVVVGIIDSGIDFGHQNFRKASGETRILAIWDQTLTPEGSESSPAPFGYGVEYTEGFINSALTGSGPSVRQKDSDGHGTHVAGTAAGDGSQSGNCHGADTYIGVAPEADLVIVKRGTLNTDDANGVSYIFDKAGSQAAAVNLSIGGQIGPHDGTDALERHIENELAATTGRVVVVSAGNDGDDGLHASKDIAAGDTVTLTFTVPPDDEDTDWLELWYGPGAARLRFTLTDPTGAATAPVNPGDPAANQNVNNHTIWIDSNLNNPHNTRHQISVNIAPPAGGSIAAGRWGITLQETAGTATRVDAWLDREKEDPFPEFIEADRDATITITEPGTGRDVITVGAYDPDSGELADFSSRGPTADGRTKPDVAAPGVGIVAPKSGARSVWYCCDCCVDFYRPMRGTSMAAPHVTGLAALMLERNPELSFRVIRRFVQEGSRADEDTPDPSDLPDNDWGHGKVDALNSVILTPHPPGGGGGGGGGSGGGGGTPFFPDPLMTIAATLRSPRMTIRARLHELQQMFLQSSGGQLLAALVSTHFDEVFRLIHGNRRVAAVWRRSGGPELVRELLVPRRKGDAPIPESLGGAPAPQQLLQVLKALDRYGSRGLRRDVARYGDFVAACPGSRLEALDPTRFLT